MFRFHKNQWIHCCRSEFRQLHNTCSQFITYRTPDTLENTLKPNGIACLQNFTTKVSSEVWNVFEVIRGKYLEKNSKSMRNQWWGHRYHLVHDCPKKWRVYLPFSINCKDDLFGHKLSQEIRLRVNIKWRRCLKVRR